MTIIILDFETTGMAPEHGARATEVAAVRVVNGQIIDRFQSLMHTGAWIPPFIESLTGISNAMVRRAPPAARVMRDLAKFTGDAPLVAHNAAFDRKFLDAEWARVGLRREQDMLCSLLLSRRLFPDAPNHKLGTLASHIGLRFQGRAHRALADAEMTAMLWIHILDTLKTRCQREEIPLPLLRQLQKVPKPKVAAFLAAYWQ